MSRNQRIEAWVLAGALILGITACSSHSEPPELVQAVQVVRHLSAPKQLERSSFRVLYPEGTPSQFVDWLFSPFGAAEWPPRDGGPEPVEWAHALGSPTLPENVALVPRTPDHNRKKQVVIRSDDSQGVLVVEGFLDPSAPPVFHKEWPLPRRQAQEPGLTEEDVGDSRS